MWFCLSRWAEKEQRVPFSACPIFSFGKDFLAPVDGEWEKGELDRGVLGSSGGGCLPSSLHKPSREDMHESISSKSKTEEWVDWELLLPPFLLWSDLGTNRWQKYTKVPCKQVLELWAGFFPSPLSLNHIFCNIYLCQPQLSFRISAEGRPVSVSELVDAQGCSWLMPDDSNQLQACPQLLGAIWNQPWPLSHRCGCLNVWKKRWKCWRSRGMREKKSKGQEGRELPLPFFLSKNLSSRWSCENPINKKNTWKSKQNFKYRFCISVPQS